MRAKTLTNKSLLSPRPPLRPIVTPMLTTMGLCANVPVFAMDIHGCVTADGQPLASRFSRGVKALNHGKTCNLVDELWKKLVKAQHAHSKDSCEHNRRIQACLRVWVNQRLGSAGPLQGSGQLWPYVIRALSGLGTRPFFSRGWVHTRALARAGTCTGWYPSDGGEGG